VRACDSISHIQYPYYSTRRSPVISRRTRADTPYIIDGFPPALRRGVADEVQNALHFPSDPNCFIFI
jgi:hypothetical protein